MNGRQEVAKLLRNRSTKGPELVFTQDLTVEECSWLPHDFKEGDRVFQFLGTTYGCVTQTGIACSLDGGIPFFEVPLNVLSPSPSDGKEEG